MDWMDVTSKEGSKAMDCGCWQWLRPRQPARFQVLGELEAFLETWLKNSMSTLKTT